MVLASATLDGPAEVVEKRNESGVDKKEEGREWKMD